MPTVPVYQPQEALAAPPGVALQRGISVSVPSGAFGEGLGAGMIRLAGHLEREKDRADDLRATDAATEYMGAQEKVRTEWAHKHKGGAAVGMGVAWDEQLNGGAAAYRERLSPEQFEMFQRKIRPYAQRSSQAVLEHEFTQVDVQRKATDAAHMDQLALEATTARAKDLPNIIRQSQSYYDGTEEGLNNTDPLVREQKHKAIAEAIATGVIQRRILDGRTGEASALLSQYPDLEHRGTFQNQIKALNREHAADGEMSVSNVMGQLYMDLRRGGDSAAKMAELIASPAFKSLDPAHQNQAWSYMQSVVDGGARRQEEANTYAPQTMAKVLEMGDRIQNGQLTRPEEIYASVGVIGPKHAADLVTLQHTVKTDTANFNLDQQIKDTAITLNLDKEETAKYSVVTRNALTQWKRMHPNKLPTVDEADAILRQGHAKWKEIGGWFNTDKPAHQAMDSATAVPTWFYDIHKKTRRDDQIVADWQVVKDVPEVIYAAGKKAGKTDKEIAERWSQHLNGER